MYGLELEGLFKTFITIIIIGSLTFGVGGYFIGRHYGYKQGINDVFNGKIKLETKVDSTVVFKKIK